MFSKKCPKAGNGFWDIAVYMAHFFNRIIGLQILGLLSFKSNPALLLRSAEKKRARNAVPYPLAAVSAAYSVCVLSVCAVSSVWDSSVCAVSVPSTEEESSAVEVSAAEASASTFR